MVGDAQDFDREDTERALSEYLCVSAPPEHREAVSRFAVDVVKRYGFGRNKRDTRNRVSKVAQFATWCIDNGLPLEVERAFSFENIEQFALSEHQNRSAGSSIRPFLRRIGEQLVPHVCPPRAPLQGRSKAAPAVTDAQAELYLTVASAQGTAARRDRLTSCVCLSAGAGLGPIERRLVRGTDVERDRGCTLVGVGGSHPRTVPVDDPFAEPLREIAQRLGDEYLIGGGAVRANVGNDVTKFTNIDGTLPPLDFARLVSTWRLRHALDLGFDAFLFAAGIQESATLFDLIRDCEPPSLGRVLQFMAANEI